MKILICSSIYPGLAGIPTYCENVSNELLNLGHEISIVCEQEKGQKPYERIKGKKVYRIKLTRNLKKDLEIIESGIKKINKKFDLVIVLWYKYFRPILNVNKSAKKVYVLPSIRKIDIGMINKNHGFFKKQYYLIKNRFSVKLEKEAIKKADLLVCLGKNMKRQVAEEYGINKGEVIYPGVNHNRFKPRKVKKDNSALIVANLDPRKGLDRAIEVSGFLKRTEIKVIGEGSLRKDLEKQIRDKNAKRIKLLGYRNNVEEYMNKSFIYLMTSYSEGLPQVMLEAISSGLPCIAFKPEKNKIMNNSDEIITNEKNGFLVKTEKEMAEKIELLYGDRRLWERMSKNSFKLSKEYTWKKTTNKILASIRPEVSIIMAVHNNEKYLKKAITSVLNQSLKNIELIYIDDASTDNSLKIARNFEKKDKRFRIIALKKNIGQVKIFKEFIIEARGKYIAFIDGDDSITRDRLEKQAQFMNKKNLDFSYCDATILYPDGNKRIRKALPFRENFRKKLIRESRKKFDLYAPPGRHLDKKDKYLMIGGEFMIKKSAFNKIKIDEKIKNMNDHDLWFQAIGQGLKIGHLPTSGILYRSHPGQRSRNEENIRKAAKRINSKLKKRDYFSKSQPLKTLKSYKKYKNG